MAEGERPAYCGQCGSAVQLDDSFCGNCGTAVLPSAPQAEQVIPQPVAAAQGAGYGGRRRRRVWVNAAMFSFMVLLGLGAAAAFAVNGGLGLSGTSDQPPTDEQGVVPSQDRKGSGPDSAQETTQAGGQAPPTPMEVIRRLDEQTDGADVAYSGYETVTDETGTLSLEVPLEWSDVQSGPWDSTTGEGIGSQMYAARNVDRFFTDGQVEDTDEESGALLQASEEAIPGYGVDETLDLRVTDYEKVCENFEGRYPLRLSVYTGKLIAFSSCGITGDSWIILFVVEPNDLDEEPEGLVQLTIKGVGPEDVEAAERVLNSFSVNGPTTVSPEPTASETTTPGSSSSANPEAEVEEAAGEYYRAAGLEDWAYTYENLDEETQSGFTEEEWSQKNQWLADNGEVIYSVDSVYQVGTSMEYFGVALTLTFEGGTSATRETFFVYEDGEWKHRFGEEENDLFIPDATFEEFVEAQQ